MSRSTSKARPFGGAVAELRKRPESVFRVVERHFPASSDLGRRVQACLLQQRVDGRDGGFGRKGSKPLEDDSRRPSSLQATRIAVETMAAMARLLLCILSETTPDSIGGARAVHRRLWLGEGGQVRRLPGKRRGLAAKVGVSTRQLQRYLVAFERAGILTSRQPPHWRASERLRGKEHAYNVYRWLCDIPVAAKQVLARWQGWVRGALCCAETEPTVRHAAAPARAQFMALLGPPPD